MKRSCTKISFSCSDLNTARFLPCRLNATDNEYRIMFKHAKQRIRPEELSVVEYPGCCVWLFSNVSKNVHC
jgi:hypothetical protein